MRGKIFGVWVLLIVFSIAMPSFCYGEEKSEKILLCFPEPEIKGEPSSYQRPDPIVLLLKNGKEQKYSQIDLDKFVEKFTDKYKVEQIELWVEAKIESGNVTKLFVSMEGSGGCKLILKPKLNSSQ